MIACAIAFVLAFVMQTLDHIGTKLVCPNISDSMCDSICASIRGANFGSHWFTDECVNLFMCVFVSVRVCSCV